jgi:hypothetical protein
MGKFGNRNVPKFMKSEDDMPIGEGAERIQELQEGHSAPEIISLGDADGGDFITITIKTVEGEELPLEFKLDDEKEETEEEGIYKGTLSAEHNDVTYTINCEIEEAGNGDFDIKIGEVTVDSMPADDYEEEEEISESKVLRFNQFMNESMGMDDYEDDNMGLGEGMNCSENAKMAIKSICEEMLCKEGMEYDMNEMAEHTYEGYTQACMEYMKSCMMEAWNK